MTVLHQYDARNNLIKVEVTDILKSGDILKYFSDIIDEETIFPEFIDVVDLSMLEDIEIKWSDLEKIAVLARRFREKGHLSALFLAYSAKAQSAASFLIPIFREFFLDMQVCKKEKDYERMLSILLASRSG